MEKLKDQNLKRPKNKSKQKFHQGNMTMSNLKQLNRDSLTLY